MKIFLSDNYIGIDEVGKMRADRLYVSSLLESNIFVVKFFFEITDSQKKFQKKRDFLSNTIKKGI